ARITHPVAQEVQFRLVLSTNPNAFPNCNYESLRQRQQGTLKDREEIEADENNQVVLPQFLS
ncbi:MAG: hypothetical protein KDB22_04610, partial [Planctomycetales bacterium]|nr:hypothetical protein [Planctomycetales bacterium]